MPCEFLLCNQIVMEIGICGMFLSIHPPRRAKSVGCMLNFIFRGPSFRTPQGKATLPETKITEPLKIKGWNTNFFLGPGLFSGVMLALGSVIISPVWRAELLVFKGENYRYKPRKPMLAERLGG